jgi:biofilm PGA synthesis N-glycosyltransferase PgaC
MTLAWGKYWEAINRNKFLNFLIGRTVVFEVPPNYKPKITVLISAYNEEQSIGDTIKSIQTQSYTPTKIIVIDDHSTDETSKIAKSMNVIVVRTPKNGGKANALNYALLETDLVDTELFLTLDADTILDHKALENLVPAMVDPKTFSACGFVIPQVINTFWEIGRFGQYLYLIGLNKQAQNNVGVTLVSSGCFALYNTALVVKLGGFPAEAIIEDIPLTWKAHMAGYNVMLMPTAICYPIDPPTWKIYNAQCSRWQSAILQSMSLYKWKLLKKKRLALLLYWYVLSGLLMPLAYFPVVGYLAYSLATGAPVPTILLLWVGFDFLLTFVYIMYGGIRHQGVKKSFKAWLFYWMIAPVDGYIFLKTIWKEWIIGERLVVWNKGH